MAFKRALWSSGYTYQMRCPYCGTTFTYNDRQLDYRAWFPNGFVYCMTCRKPLRHNEYYAINPDGTRVYRSPAEAEQATRMGYYQATGMAAPPQQSQQYAAPQSGTAFCRQCGRPYNPGTDHFCAGCGNKLD